MTDMEMTSRERMLAALNGEQPDHPPCSFMLYNGLKATVDSYLAFVQQQVDMGLDAYVELPPRPPVVANDYYNLHGLPVSYDPRVEVEEWIEEDPGEQWPIMVKVYHTPGGALRAEVRQTDDWRWGDHVPFLDDYIVPRSRTFLVSEPADLDALQYLLAPLSDVEVEVFHREAAPALAMAEEHDLLVAGGWGVGADMLGWLFGFENMIYAIHDRPAFVHDLLDMIADWNRARMAVLLDAGIDLYIKRAWYANCDFWSPATFREFLLPVLQADAELAHNAGAKLGYIITSNTMPLLDLFAEGGIDVLIGVDPMAWDMQATKERIGSSVCLWGGVNGHLTVEHGSEGDVRAAVRRAMDVLAPGGGFILSPVDNVREDTPTARANVTAFIDEWRRLTG